MAYSRGQHQIIDKLKAFYSRWVYMGKLFKLIISIASKEMAIMLVLTISLGLLPLLSIFSLQQLVNAISQLGDAVGFPSTTILWMALLILALVLQSVGNIYGNMSRDHIQERIKARIQKLIISKTHKLSLAQFENGELYDKLQRANNGLENRLFSTMAFTFQSITHVITLVSLLIYLLFIHWSIPLVLLVGSVIFTLVQVRLFIERYILDREQTTEMRKLSYFERLMTTREAAREIRLYQLGNHLKGNWHALNDKLRKERLGLVRRESRLEMISSGGNTLTFAFVLTGIVYFATLGLLSVGQYAAFIRAVLQFQSDMSNLLWDIALIDNDLRYIQDFFDYLELPEETVSGIELLEKSLVKGIACEQISFTYPGSDQSVFSQIDLAIKPGERIALVGNNGSGKTTLIKVLLGLYKPTAGRVLVEGIDLQEADLATWRKKCTAIFQDFHKYHVSVKDNIAIGQIEKIDDYNQIKKAAQSAGADAMIQQLAAGYDTFLGKEFNGEELSQGQWQKVAIARAYVRDAELLILDEPTAALDPQAEVDIYKQFQDVAQGKTTIFISHRLGICKLADRIIVLNNGGIAEQGTHDQLMAENGHYAGMYRLQSQWYA
ncbi:ABC transporter ATP-binding protein [Sporosarcina sp. YIM B06819]|uniref:ABC transporter ATP-binding protein n=1 Tax=Sporosarcina sp. YIM B06819 TaxID=3081769 RepID=UPI00298BE926|nr:ABC transporter ATP-binding protein [Sporosarcina sp. YIM B06819]